MKMLISFSFDPYILLSLQTIKLTAVAVSVHLCTHSGRPAGASATVSGSGILNHIPKTRLDKKSSRPPPCVGAEISQDRESSRLGRLETPRPEA